MLMNSFIEMDIFFFITTIVVIAIGVLFVVILLRIWRILGHVEEISKDVSAESALMRDDIADLRSSIREHGLKMSYLKVFLSHALKRFSGKPRKAAHHADKLAD
jgi:hypothetical protein